jgi:hypothetical protein
LYVIDSLVETYLSEISVIGKMYNTSIKLPMIFRHFGDYPGLGEAYHIGVFGKTGSGKSYLARMILLSYAKNEDMSLILIDPQGEFSNEIHNSGTRARDTMRVITVPESLNGITGLKASYLGSSHDFYFLEVDEILRNARFAKASIVGLSWMRASNLEIRPLASQLDPNHSVRE